MSLAPELDPYRLPPPTPGSPVVLPHLVGELNAHCNTRYIDHVWPLAPLTDNPSANQPAIHWNRCPPGNLRDEIRLLAWTLINGQLRPSFLAARGTTLRSRVSVGLIYESVLEWIRLAIWLAEQRISTLADCDTTVFHTYAQHRLVTGRGHRISAQKKLVALTRLWAFDQLSSHPTGIGQPPWEATGIDDYLPAAPGSGGENTTEPLSEQTMGPLLIWAMRMVDDFADDILAAHAERQRVNDVALCTPSTPSGQAALHAYLDPLLAAGAPLPATERCGQTTIARHYLAARVGASPRQVDRFKAHADLAQIAAHRPGPCPLDSPVTGRIAGKSWREAIDYNESPDLMRHLGTAAFIVCSYLTGMRTGEVLGLRTGCCPDPVPDDEGRIGRHLIRSNAYKTATDEHGNHHSAGLERDVPWVAITPVVNAIRVLERMVPDGQLLFDRFAHDLHNRRLGSGSLKSSTLGQRIDDFVAWANTEADQQRLPHEAIPDDPHGRIGTMRFRRRLACARSVSDRLLENRIGPTAVLVGAGCR